MDKPIIIAGPCAVESYEQVIVIAEKLKEMGVEYLRGGAFKPRTNPDSFQGLGKKGLEILKKVKKKTGLKIVTEVIGSEDILTVSVYADVLQIGSRNMQNYDLLKKIGERAPEKTILLKRGMNATKRELLGSIKYLKQYGHKGEIMVCERGIRTFANNEYSRFTLDVNLIADLKNDKNFKYKVIVDPSHTAGRKELVEKLTYVGISAGADGAIIEVKPFEDYESKSDNEQAITLDVLERIVKKIKLLIKIL